MTRPDKRLVPLKPLSGLVIAIALLASLVGCTNAAAPEPSVTISPESSETMSPEPLGVEAVVGDQHIRDALSRCGLTPADTYMVWVSPALGALHVETADCTAIRSAIDARRAARPDDWLFVLNNPAEKGELPPVKNVRHVVLYTVDTSRTTKQLVLDISDKTAFFGDTYVLAAPELSESRELTQAQCDRVVELLGERVPQWEYFYGSSSVGMSSDFRAWTLALVFDDYSVYRFQSLGTSRVEPEGFADLYTQLWALVS
jgi:hypothetical protein